MNNNINDMKFYGGVKVAIVYAVQFVVHTHICVHIYYAHVGTYIRTY